MNYKTKLLLATFLLSGLVMCVRLSQIQPALWMLDFWESPIPPCASLFDEIERGPTVTRITVGNAETFVCCMGAPENCAHLTTAQDRP